MGMAHRAHMSEYLDPSWLNCLERIRRCGLSEVACHGGWGGGRIWEFQKLFPGFSASYFGSRCELSAVHASVPSLSVITNLTPRNHKLN